MTNSYKQSIEEDANAAESLVLGKKEFQELKELLQLIGEAEVTEKEQKQHIFNENLIDIKINRWLKLIAITIGLIIPLCILYITYNLIHNNIYLQYQGWTQVIIISLSMLSFIVIYGIVIKGLLQSNNTIENRDNNKHNNNSKNLSSYPHLATMLEKFFDN